MGQISDEFWSLVEPLMPSRAGLRGRPCADGRLMLEGIAWRYRTGTPWRDVPAEFGPWKTVWKRHRRLSADGTYVRMLEVVRGHFDVVPDQDEPDDLAAALLISADSTVVRAHQHAAGARKIPASDIATAATDTGGSGAPNQFGPTGRA